ILPVTPKPETREAVLHAAHDFATELRANPWHNAPLEVHLDQRDLGGGVKNWEWIKRGVPLRVELGPRDLESGQVAVSRRDGLAVAGIADPGKLTSKSFLPSPEFIRGVSDL